MLRQETHNRAAALRPGIALTAALTATCLVTATPSALAAAPAGPTEIAAAPTLRVALNIGRVVDFSAPVSAVIVGNPLIANASLVDQRHILLTGHGIGITNLIAFDLAGRKVYDGLIEVGGLPGAQVNVYRGASSVVLQCASDCQPIATIPAPSAAGPSLSGASAASPGAAVSPSN